MAYSEILIKPMREDLTRFGIDEARTVDEVDRSIAEAKGTLMIVVNSVCGCAAGKARPGIGMALQHEPRPDRVITVFAGADLEATARARSYFEPYPPSSPQIGLIKDGKLVYIMERHQIEVRDAYAIASELTQAFDKYCSNPALKEKEIAASSN